VPINYRRYPEIWRTRIVPFIRARSNDQCEQCGVHHGQVVFREQIKLVRKFKTVYRSVWHLRDVSTTENKLKPVKVVLTVAHLDHDAFNSHIKMDRLKHLCQLCHLRYDAPLKARKRKCGPNCHWPICKNDQIKALCSL